MAIYSWNKFHAWIIIAKVVKLLKAKFATSLSVPCTFCTSARANHGTNYRNKSHAHNLNELFGGTLMNRLQLALNWLRLPVNPLRLCSNRLLLQSNHLLSNRLLSNCLWSNRLWSNRLRSNRLQLNRLRSNCLWLSTKRLLCGCVPLGHRRGGSGGCNLPKWSEKCSTTEVLSHADALVYIDTQEGDTLNLIILTLSRMLLVISIYCHVAFLKEAQRVS